MPQIGPVFPKNELTLDDDLAAWLDSNHDIIYVALGSQAMMTEELAANMVCLALWLSVGPLD